jgi:two-component system, chemotaxis family, protein-glutamate methylesterase/glutaminase
MPLVERIITIGGSMGAFEVVKTICRGLPAELPAAVFIVLHVGASSKNLFASALDKQGPLPVVTATDGAPIEQGHIYVAPGDHHLIIEGDRIRLGHGPRENLSRPAIDPLFRSAAVSHGPRVIGAVLTGYLNDGAAGLAAIKQCGGITVVQNPADAVASDMPLGALEAADVDYRGPASDIAGILTRLVSEPLGPARPTPPELMLEVEIALGRPCDATTMEQLGDVAAISCPACGGVLSEMRANGPVRYRCQVGHAYTGEIVEHEQETSADEALRIALRIVEERVTLLQRMVRDNAHHRPKTAEMYTERLKEAKQSADTIRKTLMT